jgi:hypothetical protein
MSFHYRRDGPTPVDHHADEPDLLGRPLGVDKVVERRHDQPLGHVACGVQYRHAHGAPTAAP